MFHVVVCLMSAKPVESMTIRHSAFNWVVPFGLDWCSSSQVCSSARGDARIKAAKDTKALSPVIRESPLPRTVLPVCMGWVLGDAVLANDWPKNILLWTNIWVWPRITALNVGVPS